MSNQVTLVNDCTGTNISDFGNAVKVRMLQNIIKAVEAEIK